MTKHHHFLLVTLPAQGHINPTLQLAKNLTRAGARATFATTISGLAQLKNLPSLPGLSYGSFSDGSEDDKVRSTVSYFDGLKRVGFQNLTNLLKTLSDEGKPVTFVIYAILLPWAGEVARAFHVPSALLVFQSAVSFSIYHRFYNSQDGIVNGGGIDINDPSFSIELPGLPRFNFNDIPTILLPSNPFHATMFPIFQEHIQTLERNPNPCILVNTFDDLEPESIKSIPGYIDVIPIGPLVPYDTEKSTGNGDLFENSDDSYLQWLDSKKQASVVYVSFGSLVVLQKRAKEDIFNALIEMELPFLWVLRGGDEEEQEMIEGFKGKMKEEGKDGMIVSWCSQVEVLNHQAIGCFVTHCGWNSTLESIVAGVPMVACPQISDQVTNAKMVAEVWQNGVRAVAAESDGVLEKEEVKRCLEVVMGGGERGEEIKRIALKWKSLALDALKENGPSHKYLKEFLEKLEHLL